MHITIENNRTPTGEMSWVVITDEKGRAIGNIGLIDFPSDRLKYKLQKEIGKMLKRSLTMFNEYGIF